MSGVKPQPKFRNKTITIQPTIVGPVGDVLQTVRLRQSCPELPMRYNKTFSTSRVGMNIQDGDIPSFNTGFYWADTIVSGFNVERKMPIVTVQDIIPADRLIIPETVAMPSYSWENLKAETYKAQVSGNAFLPLPGKFAPAEGSVPRGGAVPGIAAQTGAGTFTPMGANTGFDQASYYDKMPETDKITGSVYGQPIRQDVGLAAGVGSQGGGIGIAGLREATLAQQRPTGFMNY